MKTTFITKTEARKILKVHNEWRRDFRMGKMQSAFDVGQAIDVLCEPPAISQALRDAAVSWPQFLSDEDDRVLHAFLCNSERSEFWGSLYSCDKMKSLTFMLFVAEALE